MIWKSGMFTVSWSVDSWIKSKNQKKKEQLENKSVRRMSWKESYSHVNAFCNTVFQRLRTLLAAAYSIFSCLNKMNTKRERWDTKNTSSVLQHQLCNAKDWECAQRVPQGHGVGMQVEMRLQSVTELQAHAAGRAKEVCWVTHTWATRPIPVCCWTQHSTAATPWAPKPSAMCRALWGWWQSAQTTRAQIHCPASWAVQRKFCAWHWIQCYSKPVQH